MTEEFPKNTDNIEKFYQDELQTKQEYPSDNLYDNISAKMIPLNSMAIKKRRSQRVMYVSLAANVVLIIGLCWYSLTGKGSDKEQIHISKDQTSDSLNYNITTPQINPE